MNLFDIFFPDVIVALQDKKGNLQRMLRKKRKATRMEEGNVIPWFIPDKNSLDGPAQLVQFQAEDFGGLACPHFIFVLDVDYYASNLNLQFCNCTYVKWPKVICQVCECLW